MSWNVLRWFRICIAALVLLTPLLYPALARTGVADAAPCPGSDTGGQPNTGQSSEAGPNPGMAAGGSGGGGIVPTGPPTAGSGGGVSYCAQNPTDPQCSKNGGVAAVTTSGEHDGGTSGLLYYASSAPGQRGHGSLLMLDIPAVLNQSSSPCVPTPAITSAAVPCPPAPAAPALPDPKTVAQGVALPWPDFQIRAKPDNLGLTGLPSWFWIKGYAGGPLTASRHIHLDGLPNVQAGCPGGPGADEDVQVRAIPFAYEWHFGDHLPTSSVATTSLGVAYPQKAGAITHQYQTTSAGSGDPDGFTITVVAHFRVQFQTGAGWQTLTEVSRQSTIAYKVAQAYPVIVH